MKNPLSPQEKSILLDTNQMGNIIIAHNTIKEIILRVVIEIPGVAEKDMNFITNLWAKKTGASTIREYYNDELEIEVHIKVYFGKHIPTIANEVQKAVSKIIVNLIGVKYVIVNIVVFGVILEETPRRRVN